MYQFTHQKSRIPKKTLLAACCALFYSNCGAAADTVEYDSSFLMGSGASTIDVKRYAQGNPTPPGLYNARVFVNGQPISSLEIPFVDIGENSAAACITHKNLAQLHIKQPEHPVTLLAREGDEEDCLNLEKSFAQADIRFDGSDQFLNLTIPQAYVLKNYGGYVDPSLWESGINAATLSYSLNAYHTSSDDNDNDSVYGALNSGINLGAWHFRARGNYNWTKESGSHFDFQDRYLQRDIPAMRSQVIMGDSYTTGETFDSVNVRGIRLYSDSRMLPSALASYAPTIRGVANSNAKVTVTQSGYKIYETTVPPGEFVIDDVSPSGFGSELIVTIEEADGSKRTFTQPFSSVVQMQRPGVGRWDFSAGKVIDDGLRSEPNMGQTSFYYGLNNFFTGYTGIQFTDNDYIAGLLGLGINTGIGAFAVDVTHSRTQIPDDKTYQGQSYRVTWNKLFEDTGTSFNLAAYRYSTQDYLGLHDALVLIDDAKHLSADEEKNTMQTYSRMKNQFTVSINQPLNIAYEDYGSLFISGSWTDYWAANDSRTEYNIGYSKSVSWGSFSVNLQRSWNENGDKDDAMYISVSVPIENIFGGKRKSSGFRNVNTQLNTDFDGSHQLNINSSGSSESNLVNYSVNTGYSLDKNTSDIASVGGYINYESGLGGLSASASATSDNSQQYSISTDGGFILHGGGLTFTNNSFSNNDTLVLIKAPGAKGARLNNSNNEIDRWGYAVTSSVSPYRENRVGLNIETMENDVELKSTSATTVPRSGSIVLTRFETDQGRSAVLNITANNGKAIPFAAEVYQNEIMIGSMGQGGQAFVRGINDNGELTVSWFENNQTTHCKLHYQLPVQPQTLGNTNTLLLNDLICQVANH
ncbi:outer membrane usher protein [Escherichia albertii]|uniref:Outer membrane usher protein n=1 Tax=Escherichia albertii TaxID=208962 RepID=A0AAX3MKH6_ESCAL|nr:outer membrane usher protein [Escherichia albertii]MCZ8552072.1 outer membrane usher protein [Escherichia albertii]MCZ8956354.1 outer membrane usher protein [Escherichia albertii]WDB29648.1 outer membrane usher protein [Escherichia albertii]WDC10577.1 outer membrane usher protein [Escherichia albertii]